MAVEIEVKVPVEGLDAVREALQRAGATCRGQVLETNNIYDRPDGSLAANDSALRLRTVRRPDGTAGAATMTFKGPRRPGKLKIRPEFEIEINNFAVAADLLQSLGFQRRLVFQKRRQTWQLEGCTVELDELPHLGTFVEVEGPQVETVQRVCSRIGLGERQPTRKTYVEMLVEYCRRVGMTDYRVVFND